MKLAEYLDGMRAATTAEELEAAVRADFKHSFRGRTWSQICKVREEVGYRIVAAHPNGRYVPRFGTGRKLEVCERTFKVGRGQNSTGVRYCWHYAGEFVKGVLREEGFSLRAASRIWDNWGDYPHRCLPIVAKALAGEIPDPELGVLIRHKRTSYGKPINYSVEKNDADKWDRRASRPCECGGTLFDWGAGHSEGFDYVNWHCCACPDVFTEYMTHDQLCSLRQGARNAQEAVDA